MYLYLIVLIKLQLPISSSRKCVSQSGNTQIKYHYLKTVGYSAVNIASLNTYCSLALACQHRYILTLTLTVTLHYSRQPDSRLKRWTKRQCNIVERGRGCEG